MGRFAARISQVPWKSAQNKTALTLSKTRFFSEAEGSRTLNLRIDSLSEAFVSICQQTINGYEQRTYDAGRCAPEAA
jgi:hypothetical protein